MNRRPQLRLLADRLGILPGYRDATGKQRVISDKTRVALLAALGLDASTEHAAAQAMESLRPQDRERILHPVQVARWTSKGPPEIAWRSPRLAESATWQLRIIEENGENHLIEGRGRRTTSNPLNLTLNPGYHRLVQFIRRGPSEHCSEQSLIVAPCSCPQLRWLESIKRVRPRFLNGSEKRLKRARPSPQEASRTQSTARMPQILGICANLYSIRSKRNWGVGDFGDLVRLCRWAADCGAGFVGLNPLHAVRNRGTDVSPYSPVSRVYRNAAYLDVMAVPELALSIEARNFLASKSLQMALGSQRKSTRIDYEQVMRWKLHLLRMLHRTFLTRDASRRSARRTAFAKYVEREGRELLDFATFMALDDYFSVAGRSESAWPRWPVGFRSPTSDAVIQFQRDHADEVDFHCYLQFELDRQLAAAADHSQTSGMALGLYQDLAIGTSQAGSDVWARPDRFVLGASLGAPPDRYAPLGQYWELTPLNPHRLQADGYRYWIQILRSALAHSGALRIDHVMGLLRQFWIPAGRPASEGAYVRFPWDDLTAILALEAYRHRALVIGEDLGTVPTGFTRKLADQGILSTRVLFFERTPKGGFRPASRYSNRAMVTATTHDLGPLAGYLEGRDLTLRRRAGAIASERAFRSAVTARRHERQALITRLINDGLLPKEAVKPTLSQIRVAVHRFLERTPAPLVGVMLDDLADEVEPVNLPGVGPSRHASWTRPMRRPLERIFGVRQATGGQPWGR